MSDLTSIPDLPDPVPPKKGIIDSLKIPRHPELRAKLEQAIDRAVELKYETEQAEAKKASGR